LTKKTPSLVRALPGIARFILALSPEDSLGKKIANAMDKLEEDAKAGTQVEKDKIPKYYSKRHNVSNLFVLRLDEEKRLVYTIQSDGKTITANILDIFSDHKSYENRFGY
jgi:Txe/YoeB family toxin of Txe-Axe toxin-antitoxin module